MPPVFYKAPLPINYKVPKGRIVPLKKPEIRLGKTLVTLTPRRIKADVLEKVRMSLKRILKKHTERIVDVHATYPVSKKPDGVKMGQGKGKIHHHVARVPAGYPIIRIPQLSPFVPGELPIFVAFQRALSNLPVSCTFRSQSNNFKVDSLIEKQDLKLKSDSNKTKSLLNVMKRGVGYSNILKKKEEEKKLQELSQKITEENKEEYLKILEDFRGCFETFIRRNYQCLREDPNFRIKFLEMCNLLSIDPLALSPGLWPRLTFGSLFPEICTFILEICINTRDENGGICDVDYILDMIPKKYNLTRKGIIRAAKELEVFGEDSVRIVEINGRTFLVSNLELTENHKRCLEVATNLKRGVSCSDISEHLNWTKEKAKIVLNKLTTEQVTWIDRVKKSEGEDREEIYYWFTSLINRF